MPPCVSLLSGPLGVPPILILKLPSMSNFRTKPSPPSLLVAQGVLPARGRARRGISRDPDVVVLVDINAMLAVGPDAACLRLAFAADETGIGRTAPGAQQLAVGIELQHGRSGFAAIRDGAIGAHLAQPVDRLALLVGGARHGPFQPGLVVGHGARPVVDPDMVMRVDIEPADLAQKPVVRQRLRPCGIDHETRRLAGARCIVHARLLE